MANIKKDFASPNGPILLLSAKGSTTASIAQANGVKDFSGNGNHGQAFSGVSVVQDSEMCDCFSFDGVDDYILINSVNLSNKTAVTFSFLFKPNSLTNQLILAKRITAQELNFSIWNNGKLYFSTWNSSNVGSEPFFQLTNDDIGKYKHVVGVLDNDSQKVSLYIDGVFVKEVANNGTGRFANNNPITIGSLDRTTSNYHYNGLIADVRIYPRALSAAEIKYLYNGFQPNLIMGQTIPSGAILDLSARGLTTSGIAQANGVVDRSGNGNHGQAYNGVAVVNDDEVGSCFSFDGTGYAAISSVDLRNATAVTLHCNVAPQEITRDGYLFFSNRSTDCWSFFCDNHPDYGLGFEFYNSSNKRTQIISRIPTEADAGKWITLTATVDNVNKLVVLYEDGIEVGRSSTNGTVRINNNYTIAVGTYLVNNTIYRLLGKMASVKIYPRVLTVSEIQQLVASSFKKVSRVQFGNVEAKQVYYGSNLIYAAVSNYRPPLSGYAVLTNPKDNSIVKLTASTFTNAGLWNGTLILPDGNILVTYGRNDRQNSCIKILSSSTGTEIYSYGSHGTNEGQFRMPSGVAYNPETGDIYIGEYNGNTQPTYITKFNYDGERLIYLKRISIPTTVFGMYYSKARNAVLVAGWTTGRAYQVDSNLTAYQELTNTNFPSYAGEQCITCTSDGLKIYIGQYSGRLCEATFASASAVAASSYRTLISNSSGPDVCSVQMLSDDVTLLVATRTDSLTSKEVFLFNTSTKTKTIISDSSWPPLHTLQYNGNNVFTGVTQNSSANQIDVYRLNLNF